MNNEALKKAIEFFHANPASYENARKLVQICGNRKNANAYIINPSLEVDELYEKACKYAIENSRARYAEQLQQ
jgi:hypothetical protein